MRFCYFGLLLAITLSLTSISSVARDRESGIYLTGLLGYAYFDHERELEDDPNVAVGIGYDFSRVWSSELIIGIGDLEAKDSEEDIDQLFGRFDTLYHFNPESKWRPFIVAGVGHNELEDRADNEIDETQFNMGFGLKHEVNDMVDVRFDARGLYSHDEESKDAILNLGVNFLLGSSRSTPVDSDGDGVYDTEDQCPATAAGTQTDTSGCPVNLDADGDGVNDDQDQCPASAAGISVDEQGCTFADDDGDGINNKLDQCDNTVAGAPVDANGCMLDADKDGIHDNADTCSDTPPGAKVDELGCRLILEEAVSMTLQVTFPSNSADVPAQYLAEIEKVAEFMRQYPDTDVVIEGHSDSMGEDAYNQQLSEKRAQAVRDVLVERFQIEAGRISSVGFGEANPIADNSTKAGREQNRRVVAVIETVRKVEQ